MFSLSLPSEWSWQLWCSTLSLSVEYLLPLFFCYNHFMFLFHFSLPPWFCFPKSIPQMQKQIYICKFLYLTLHHHCFHTHSHTFGVHTFVTKLSAFSIQARRFLKNNSTAILISLEYFIVFMSLFHCDFHSLPTSSFFFSCFFIHPFWNVGLKSRIENMWTLTPT